MGEENKEQVQEQVLEGANQSTDGFLTFVILVVIAGIVATIVFATNKNILFTTYAIESTLAVLILSYFFRLCADVHKIKEKLLKK